MTFAEWVATQPADEPYMYGDGENCPFFHYLKAEGQPVAIVGGYVWLDTQRQPHDIPDHEIDALVEHPRTYGALLGRLI